jgi:hypothetical protein
MKRKKYLAVAFNSTFRYVDDVLSINNNQFQTYMYIYLIYPNELEIKDNTEGSSSASYLDILLKLNTNGKITTQFYDKRMISISPSSTFLFLCSNISISLAFGVYISQLIRYGRVCLTYGQFLIRDSLLTKKLMSRVFYCLVYKQLSASFTTISLPIQSFFGSNAV